MSCVEKSKKTVNTQGFVQHHAVPPICGGEFLTHNQDIDSNLIFLNLRGRLKVFF